MSRVEWLGAAYDFWALQKQALEGDLDGSPWSCEVEAGRGHRAAEQGEVGRSQKL